jgi:hypothetical protein
VNERTLIYKRGVVALLETQERLCKEPSSIQQLAVAANVNIKTMRQWIQTMQAIGKVKPFGVQPLEPGRGGTGSMLWVWVVE